MKDNKKAGPAKRILPDHSDRLMITVWPERTVGSDCHGMFVGPGGGTLGTLVYFSNIPVVCNMRMRIAVISAATYVRGRFAVHFGIRLADQNGIVMHVRKRSTRYDECFCKLPDEFKTQHFMDCFGVSQPTASRSIDRFLHDGMIERVKHGVYRKLLQELP